MYRSNAFHSSVPSSHFAVVHQNSINGAHTRQRHTRRLAHTPRFAPGHSKIQIFVQTKILAEKFSHEFEICSYSYGSACLVLCSSSFFLLSFNFNTAGHDIANIEFHCIKFEYYVAGARSRIHSNRQPAKRWYVCPQNSGTFSQP